MSEENNHNGTENGDVPEIELIIKASTIDGRRKGACLFCQEYFMDLFLLAELKTISLKVTTVNMQKPPPDFRNNFEATPPPILIDNGLAVLENEKIERHIMKNVPGGHNLFVQDKEVATLIENLYSKLKLMLLNKNDVTSNNLLSHLRKINDHLGRKGTRFLTGDTMCCFDCELMPRLQHIRVAGKYFLDFEIPNELNSLWRYMLNMYQLDAFTQSCPADQDIINHYKHQQGVVDDNYRFTAIDVGGYGKQSDGGTFAASAIGILLENNQLPIPTKKCLPNTTVKVQHVFIADEAYPLKGMKLKKHEELETPTFTTSIPIGVSIEE